MQLWATAKAVPRGKFMALSATFRKEEKLKLIELTVHLKKLEKCGKLNLQKYKRGK